MIEAKPMIEANVSSEASDIPSDTKGPLSNDGGKPMMIPDRRYRKW
jgi:hypothetical protein